MDDQEDNLFEIAIKALSCAIVGLICGFGIIGVIATGLIFWRFVYVSVRWLL